VDVYTADNVSNSERKRYWQDVGNMAVPAGSKKESQQDMNLVIADRNLLDSDGGKLTLVTTVPLRMCHF
jgi:hypothetical protein